MNYTKLSVAEAAEILGITQQHLRIALQRGTIPVGSATKISGNKYTYDIYKEKIEAWMSK